jgi:hypothetical protein
MPVIEGVQARGISGAGVPSAGTNAVQTLTIGGTPTAGSFQLIHEGFVSAAITWSAVNATLLAAMNAAMDAMPSLGTAGCVATAGTLTAGIGTVTLTFGATRAKQPVGIFTFINALTGTSPTLAVANTTPGVLAVGRGMGIGQVYIDTTAGKAYINTGTSLVPVWTVVGAQT